MPKEPINAGMPDLLNSSFYSSTSINTLDHAKNFRNSLILRDLSEQSFNMSVNSNESSNFADSTTNGHYKLQTPGVRNEETATMKMSTSPSLSALAGILNEKSRQAEGKVRSGNVLNSSIVEEEEDDKEKEKEKEEGVGDILSSNLEEQLESESVNNAASPNLIDVTGTDSVHFPSVHASSNPFISEQPDFLSTPRVESSDSLFKEQPTVEAKRALSETAQLNSGSIEKDLRKVRTKYKGPTAQRTISAGSVLEQTSYNKKKKNFFSFLRKKNPGEPPKNDINSNNKKITTSTTFSTGGTVSPLSPDKLSKKSSSSNNIFSTFRKNKEVRKGLDSRLTTSPKIEINATKLNTASSFQYTDVDINSDQTTLPKKDIKKRKPTPLSLEHTANNQKFDDEKIKPSASFKIVTQVYPPAKPDTGEVLFPKSLDKFEVESIVSLERSRSTKSNKRSSVTSYRRSLTDNLSLNAQNEGMFVTEAASVVLSTPDLSKSPASSILRNGKFDPADFSSSNPIFINDQREASPFEKSQNDTSLGMAAPQDRISMISIEEKINEFTIESEEENNVQATTIGESDRNGFENDPEFISDIMEFASIINFGDGINLDLDLNTTDPKYRPFESPTLAEPELQRNVNTETADKMMSRSGLGISGVSDMHDIEEEKKLPTRKVRDDEFENEDFNQLSNSPHLTPKFKAYIPDPQISRPISMSFRGLKAPSFNASVIGSSATESLTRTERSSVQSSEKKFGNSVNFSSRIILYDTYDEEEYDRKPDIATCNQLTPQLAQIIKAELNELKSGMEVHEDSRCYTHFF